MRKLTSADGYPLAEMIDIITEKNQEATRCILVGIIASEVGKQLDKEDIAQMFYALDIAGIRGTDIVTLFNKCGSAMAFMGLIGLLVVGKAPEGLVKMVLSQEGEGVKHIVQAHLNKHFGDDDSQHEGNDTCH